MKEEKDPALELVRHKVGLALPGYELPEFSQAGRIRLVNALMAKHGQHFRHVAEAKAAIDAYDSEFGFVKQLRKLRRT